MEEMKYWQNLYTLTFSISKFAVNTTGKSAFASCQDTGDSFDI
jgi:hypothetical protein